MRTILGAPAANSPRGPYFDKAANCWYYSNGQTSRVIAWRRGHDIEDAEIPARVNADFVTAQALAGEDAATAAQRLLNEYEKLMNLSRRGPLPPEMAKRYDELSSNLLTGK